MKSATNSEADKLGGEVAILVFALKTLSIRVPSTLPFGLMSRLYSSATSFECYAKRIFVRVLFGECVISHSG